MKKSVLAIMVGALCIILSSCQETPEESSVVSKVDGISEAAVCEPLKKGEKRETNVPTHWKFEEKKSNDRVVIQADIKLGEQSIGNLPVIEMQNHELTQEELNGLIDYFTDGEELYMPQMVTKDAYQEVLDRISSKEGSYLQSAYSTSIAGQMIRCGAYPGTHGVQTPADVLKNSCNAGMMQIGQKMGAAEFLRYQDIFGFGSLTGIDLPGEAYGLVHTEDTMGPTELATSTFGQGYTVTMVQQAAAFSSLINGGNYYQPHVMKTITDSTGAVVESNEPNLVRQTVSAEISDKMRSFLQGVVTDGSGQSAKVAGYTMGGKTGTAQKYPRGNGKYLVSFIGFAPVENPKAVVYAIVDEPDVENQANSVLAQEIVKEIYTELLPYLNVFPDDTDGVTGEGSETGTDDPNVAAPVQEDDTENSAENSNIENGGLTNAELDLINEE